MSLTITQQRDLKTLFTEFNALTVKTRFTKSDEARTAFLQTAIAAVKSGARLSDLDHAEYTERAQRAGLEPAKFKNKRHTFLSEAREQEIRGWMEVVKRGTKREAWESRATETLGSMANAIGTYNTTGGTFVPTEFMHTVFAGMGAHDVLFDEDGPCTVIKTVNGRPIQVPTASDIQNVSAVIGEGSSSLVSTNLYVTGQVKLAANSYSSPAFQISMEAFDDIDVAATTVSLFEKFAADRHARGIGKDLLLSDGSPAALGLIPSLEALGVDFISAAGSSPNDGLGGSTGANSIGTADLLAAYQLLDIAYIQRSSWLMNAKTLASIAAQITKSGNLNHFVQFDNDGNASILGRPVVLSPSMPSIGASNVPIVFGDLSFWITQLVSNDSDFGTGIRVVKEAPGLVEKGIWLLKSFVRATGVLAYTDTSAQGPLTYIQNLS